MKAVRTRGQGHLDIAEVRTPEPGAGQVRVRVAAATVNPVDVAVDSGFFHQIGVIATSDPVGLGWDLAGVVDVVGEGVTDHAPGDRVAGLLPAMGVPLGALAEYAVLPAADLARVPDGLSFSDATAVVLNGLTAAQAIDLLGPGDGRTLLVTGAAGAVGGFALELLREGTWKVSGLARASDAAFVADRGATLVTDLDAVAGSFDAVFDAAALQEAAVGAVRPGGRFLGVLPAAPVEATGDRSTAAVAVVPDGALLGSLLERASAGGLTVRVAGVVDLADVGEAFARVAAGGRRGRWVVRVG